jgi:hypothetical protein
MGLRLEIAMAEASTSIIDVILVVFVILVVLITVWVFEPALLAKACYVLPNVLQHVLGCN